MEVQQGKLYPITYQDTTKTKMGGSSYAPLSGMGSNVKGYAKSSTQGSVETSAPGRSYVYIPGEDPLYNVFAQGVVNSTNGTAQDKNLDTYVNQIKTASKQQLSSQDRSALNNSINKPMLKLMVR